MVAQKSEVANVGERKDVVEPSGSAQDVGKSALPSESINDTDNAEVDEAQHGNKSPKSQTKIKDGRKRKRHLFNAIRAQMEFYFGDANLTKDRFLKQLIDKDPYVPLEVFLSFNKLKVLTQSVEHIAKSLTNSQLLELDETGQKVRRKTAVDAERNVDDKTLYVEALPTTADHDWVRQVFERFGPVTYVSLPRYATSRKIKEFAFVEFEREGSVEKAVKAFQHFNGVLSLQGSDPADLCSVRAYVRENQPETLAEPQDQQENESHKKGGEQHPVDENENTEKKRKRRHKSETECEEDEKDEATAKKLLKVEKLDGSIAADAAACSTTETEQSEDGGNDGEVVDEKTSQEADVKKRRKKKKKKQKFNQYEMDPSCFDLKILPKRDWKRLRNKYLNLQREKVAELKRKYQCRHKQQHGGNGGYQPKWSSSQQLQTQQKQESNANNSEDHENAANDEDAAPQPAKRMKSSNVHKMNMNFYGAGDGELDETATTLAAVANSAKVGCVKEENPAQQRTPLFSREPGLIVEVSFLEPCVNVKEFKADMRQYATVKYVDVKEGAMQAFLRLESSTAAEEFISQLNSPEYKCKILRGKAESRYWKKIETDREMKLNKQVKVQQKRGREKVKKLLASHIHFGDDDDNADEPAEASTPIEAYLPQE